MTTESSDTVPLLDGEQLAALGLSPFRYEGVVLEPETLRYSPHPDIIHPSVVDLAVLGEAAPARYAMYYAPHNAPGGICVAFADSLDGPWREYEANPVIEKTWEPHYQVSHVSSPHALILEREKRLLLYFHGENNTTRYAETRDAVNFQYGGTAVSTASFEPGLTEASYARVFPWAGRFVMVLMGNLAGTRNVYLAWSPDGRNWSPRPQAWLTPPPGTSQMGPGTLFSRHDRTFFVCFANRADAPVFDPVSDLYLYEVSADLAQTELLGMLMDHREIAADNFRISDPCLVEGPESLYLFINIGRRLSQRIGLAVAR